MKIKKYIEFINEGSLGSDEIRKKHYSDLEKSKYYEIINIDPTSIRKKDFSKPGKYSKWLLHCYKINQLTDTLLLDKTYVNNLNFYLFIFSTNWYKNKFKQNQVFFGGEITNLLENDINKYSLFNFINKLTPLRDEYLSETEQAKMDIIYSNDYVDIMVPLNFTASRETALNTQWCSSNFTGYSIWNKTAILFRIIPKDNTLDKIKFTYRYNGQWFLAGPKYPELIGNGNPFEIIDGKPSWLLMMEEQSLNIYDNVKIIFSKIKTTMNLLDEDAISCIVKYYELNRK